MTTNTTGWAEKLDDRREVHVLLGPGILGPGELEPGSMGDRDLFFGPLAGDEVFLEGDLDLKMEDLMVALGLFPSKGQARKNGRGGEIPWGFSHHVIGKFRTNIWILRIA